VRTQNAQDEYGEANWFLNRKSGFYRPTASEFRVNLRGEMDGGTLFLLVVVPAGIIALAVIGFWTLGKPSRRQER